MPEFISKLQYKNYEKGEFSDEMVRPLTDTLMLIQNFPWDEQRGSDIQLTGPSVTIKNEYNDYLKLSLYFNGKFCLYLLDRNDHLFELHEPTLKQACAVVSDFFYDANIASAFEKHAFSIGSKSHFETKSFQHTVNALSFYLQFLLLTLFSGFLTITSVTALFFTGAPIALVLVFLPLTLLFNFSWFVLLKVYNKSKNMYLSLSRGSNTFQFGNTFNKIKTYSKTDVLKIDLYAGRGSARSNLTGLVEIFFKDQTSIFIPAILMDSVDVVSKFPDNQHDFIIKSYPLYKKLLKFNPSSAM